MEVNNEEHKNVSKWD